MTALVFVGLLSSCGSPQHELEMIVTGAPPAWTLMFSAAKSTPESMRIRVGDDSNEFRTTRVPTVSLPSGTGTTEVVVYYTIDGKEYGPEVFQFDPDVATLKWSKDLLNLTRTQWVSWRRLSGDNTVSFPLINMHSCALKKVDYGFSDKLDQNWSLPPCRLLPIQEEKLDQQRLIAPEGASVISIQLHFVDGTKTAVERFPIGKVRAGEAVEDPPEPALDDAARFESAMLKATELRDQRKYDKSACDDIKHLGASQGREESTRATRLCREMKASMPANDALVQATANLDALIPDIPPGCKTWIDNLGGLGTRWASERREELIRVCYEDVGLMILKLKVPDMLYRCDPAVKDVYRAFEKRPVRNEQMKFLMSKVDSMCVW